MARAYLALARNDLADSGLQLLDLVPNTSLRNPTITPAGQTGYLTHLAQADTLVLAGAGPITVTGVTYGLAAYMVDHVENTGSAGEALLAAEANAIAAAILLRIANGQSLALADINALIVAEAGAGNDLNGVLGNSTGSVEEVLRICAGEVYRLADGATVEDGGNNFVQAVAGAFVTAPNRIVAANKAGGRAFNAPLPIGSVSQAEVATTRNLGAGVTLSVPATADLNFRDVLPLVDTPDLHNSVMQGRLATLVADTFVFNNPLLVYGAGGTGSRIGGSTISATTHAARACVVYAADGSVI